MIHQKLGKLALAVATVIIFGCNNAPVDNRELINDSSSTESKIPEELARALENAPPPSENQASFQFRQGSEGCKGTVTQVANYFYKYVQINDLEGEGCGSKQSIYLVLSRGLRNANNIINSFQIGDTVWTNSPRDTVYDYIVWNARFSRIGKVTANLGFAPVNGISQGLLNKFSNFEGYRPDEEQTIRRRGELLFRACRNCGTPRVDTHVVAEGIISSNQMLSDAMVTVAPPRQFTVYGEVLAGALNAGNQAIIGNITAVKGFTDEEAEAVENLSELFVRTCRQLECVAYRTNRIGTQVVVTGSLYRLRELRNASINFRPASVRVEVNSARELVVLDGYAAGFDKIKLSRCTTTITEAPCARIPRMYRGQRFQIEGEIVHFFGAPRDMIEPTKITRIYN